jgi:hypothetical protein
MEDSYAMSDTTNKSSRRDVLKTIGGVLGGVSLLGHGPARGQALGSLPSGYKFYRVLRANEGGSFSGTPNQLGDITGSVMMASPLSGHGHGYIYVHGIWTGQGSVPSPALFEVAVNFSSTPPVVQKVRPIAINGRSLSFDGGLIVAGHIGTGASNALGEYVTTIEPIDRSGTVAVDNSPGVYLYRPTGLGGGSWSRIIRFGDPVPDGSSLYGGDFGDVALDDDENLLLAAATTKSPGNISGFAGSQALIATSLGATGRGRVLLQTGDMLPFGSAVVESVGLIDLAARNAFAAQITARRLNPSVTRSGTALLVGDTQVPLAQQGIVAASPELMPAELAAQRNIISGETFFGPRVDPLQDVAFVTHDGTFEPSIGSNALETLGYYSQGSARLLQNTQISASSDQVVSFGAPCIGSTGLMYGTEMLGDGKSRLFISNGVNSRIVLRSGVDRIPGRAPSGELTISEILFGQHSTQVDAFGRLAFTAEFLIDPSNPEDSRNVRTALVIGIPQ